jgi:hypothetical protein
MSETVRRQSIENSSKDEKIKQLQCENADKNCKIVKTVKKLGMTKKELNDALTNVRVLSNKNSEYSRQVAELEDDKKTFKAAEKEYRFQI